MTRPVAFSSSVRPVRSGLSDGSLALSGRGHVVATRDASRSFDVADQRV